MKNWSDGVDLAKDSALLTVFREFSLFFYKLLLSGAAFVQMHGQKISMS